MGSNVPPITPTRRVMGPLSRSGVLAPATEGDKRAQQPEQDQQGKAADAEADALVDRVGDHGDLGEGHAGQRTQSAPRQRTCPSPTTTYLVEVISGSPIGPRACSFWVLIPISAPKPNSPPSVNRVEAFTSTAAESTSAVNRRAAPWSSVTIASLCWLDQRRMWAMASSRSATRRAEISRERDSSPQSASVAGCTPP